MGSTPSAAPRPSADLTTRARTRDAAVRRFAADGMAAPLRAIASDAGVSAGLILHHFGSRAGLRQACDEHVLAEIRRNKATVLGAAGGPGAFLVQLAQVEGYAPLVGYVLRCLQGGGPESARFVDHLVEDAVGYLREAEEAGTVRPSRDPEARARLLAEQALGALLLQLPARQDHLDLDELPAWLRAYSERIVLPLLELYTEPLLADSTLLDAYLSARAGTTVPGDSPDRS
ncbi:TetR/AcrR family transcriptional regulator [Georgenia daeguensis]|uniref:TetR family transcriptional regulator n=1 Tax=Georgenia daeguensis TaxID=908355 RepID=A0ABP8EW71_9MICO